MTEELFLHVNQPVEGVVHLAAGKRQRQIVIE
jgi:hypothetical protein